MRDDIQTNEIIQPYMEQIEKKLQLVFDPELEVDIYNLGLVYEMTLDENGLCTVIMTFTSATCSCTETLPIDLRERLLELDFIKKIAIEIVWTPVWKLDRISRFGRIVLGISPN